MHVDTPSQIVNSSQTLWDYLASLADNPASPVRVFSLASIDAQGEPQLRSLILRQVSPWVITAYTDARSPKVQQIAEDPSVKLLFWDAEKRWQLRCSGVAEVITSGSVVSELWSSLKGRPSAQDYLTLKAPGEALEAELEYGETPALAILNFKITMVDWLQLDRSGHKRWRLTPQEVQALVP